MDILDVINEATKEANAFENHAAKDLPLEERLLYLQGLALVMNADGDIHPEEKEYILILIKSFEMDEAILDSFVEFAQRPDKDTVQAFFRTFRRRPIAQLFLFDALMMTRRDDNIDEKEKAVVDKIAEQLEVLKGIYQDIFDFFCHIKNKDWEESSLYFSSHLLNSEYFKHLLHYFDVDFEALSEKTKSLRKRRVAQRLVSDLNLCSVGWGKVSFTNDKITGVGRNISIQPIKNLAYFSYGIVIPFMQSLMDKGLLKVFDNIVYMLEGEEKKVLDLSDDTIGFDMERKVFFVPSGKSESDVVEIPDLLLFKLLDIEPSVNHLDNTKKYIEALGYKLVLGCYKDSKFFFPCIDGKQLTGHSFPSYDLGMDSNIMLVYINDYDFNKSSMTYVSSSEYEDCGGRSNYRYRYYDINNEKRRYSVSWATNQAGVISISLPRNASASGSKSNYKEFDLTANLSMKDLLSKGFYLSF